MISDSAAPTPQGVPEADYRDQHLPADEDDPADVDGELFPPEIFLPFDADDGTASTKHAPPPSTKTPTPSTAESKPKPGPA